MSDSYVNYLNPKFLPTMHRVPVGVEARESGTLPYIVRSYMARNNVIKQQLQYAGLYTFGPLSTYTCICIRSALSYEFLTALPTKGKGQSYPAFLTRSCIDINFATEGQQNHSLKENHLNVSWRTCISMRKHHREAAICPLGILLFFCFTGKKYILSIHSSAFSKKGYIK